MEVVANTQLSALNFQRENRMSTITRYRVPGMAYRAEAARSGWGLCAGGWRTEPDGSWSAVYARSRCRRARRARIWREGGHWLWRVDVFDLRTRGTTGTLARCLGTYVSAYAARPWADAAARSAE